MHSTDLAGGDPRPLGVSNVGEKTDTKSGMVKSIRGPIAKVHVTREEFQEELHLLWVYRGPAETLLLAELEGRSGAQHHVPPSRGGMGLKGPLLNNSLMFSGF